MIKLRKAEKDKKILFTCDKCGGNSLVRVSRSITSSTNLTGEVNGESIVFEEEEFDYSVVEEHFACRECDTVIFEGSALEFEEFLRSTEKPEEEIYKEAQKLRGKPSLNKWIEDEKFN